MQRKGIDRVHGPLPSGKARTMAPEEASASKCAYREICAVEEVSGVWNLHDTLDQKYTTARVALDAAPRLPK
jgi:hypothetical protein